MKYYSKLVVLLCGATLLLFSSPAMAEEGDEEAQEAPAETSAPAASASSAASGDLAVIDAKAAKGVEDREAVDESDTFSAGDTVTVWVAFRNPADDAAADIVWSAGDTEIHTYSMNIGKSYRWRTWAQLKVSRAGDWNVAIRDSDGNTLETVSFTVSDS